MLVSGLSKAVLAGTLVAGATYAPSTLVYGSVSATQTSLEPWYLKGLLNGGVSELILPGYGDSTHVSGPLSGWQALSSSDRQGVLDYAASKFARLYMATDPSLSPSEVQDACAFAKANGFSGVALQTVKGQLTSDVIKKCQESVKWVVVVTPSSAVDVDLAKSAETTSIERHVVAFNNEELAFANSPDGIYELANVYSGVDQKFVVAGAQCDSNVCAAGLEALHINENGVYVGHVPGPVDRYFKEFMTYTLPDLAGLFEVSNRRHTPACPKKI